MSILRAFVRTTTMCFYCGSMLEAHVVTLRQRCPNDCASGLGAPPADRLPGDPRGRANNTDCDTVAGEIWQ